MADKPSDAELLKRSREAALDAAAQHLRLIYEAKLHQPYGTLRSGEAIRLPDPNAAARVGSDLLRELARFSLTTHEGWVNFTKNNFKNIVDALYGGAAPEVGNVLELQVEVTAGGAPAVRRFVIVNPSVVRATVSFTQPDLISSDGTRRLDTQVVFTRYDSATGTGQPCRDMVLGPNEEGHFSLALEVVSTADHGLYCGESTVVVGNHVAGRLRMRVTVV